MSDARRAQIVSVDEIEAVLGQLNDTDVIVFTNGCFDILHPGHLYSLRTAASLGDIVVVGVNTDESVRANKGKHRPFMPEAARIELLSCLRCVDYVVPFDEPTPERLIALVEPDYLVKGSDWEADKIVGSEDAGEVVRIKRIKPWSTSAIAERVAKLWIRTNSPLMASES